MSKSTWKQSHTTQTEGGWVAHVLLFTAHVHEEPSAIVRGCAFFPSFILFLAWKKTTTLRHFQGFQIGYHYNVDSGGTSIENKDRINRRLFYLMFSQMMSFTTFASRGLKTGIWQVWSYLAAWSCSLLATAGLRVLTHSKAGTLTHMRRATDNCAPGTIFCLHRTPPPHVNAHTRAVEQFFV